MPAGARLKGATLKLEVYYRYDEYEVVIDNNPFKAFLCPFISLQLALAEV